MSTEKEETGQTPTTESDKNSEVAPNNQPDQQPSPQQVDPHSPSDQPQEVKFEDSLTDKIQKATIDSLNIRVDELNLRTEELRHANENRRIILRFILGLFAIWITLSLIYLMFTGNIQVLTAGSAVLSGPLGVIIGYYYAKEEKDHSRER